MLTGPQIPLSQPESRLQFLRERIDAATRAAGRAAGGVTLIGVGKGQPADAIRAAALAGLADVGENYLQEAAAKMDALRDLPLNWHFIGPLQGNKTRAVAERFQWVHSVDRLRIAQRLSGQRPHHAPPLMVCLQLRLGEEPTKAGIAPGDLPELAGAVAELPRIRLRGLMCIPPLETDLARQRHWFSSLRRLLELLNTQGHALDTLSMGMSADFEAAILEGATHVRVGTALFGARA